MNFVETGEKIIHNFHALRWLGAEFGNDVVNIFFEEGGSLVAFLTRNFDSLVDGVCHPDVRDGDHQQQTDESRIFCCVNRIVVDELRC